MTNNDTRFTRRDVLHGIAGAAGAGSLASLSGCTGIASGSSEDPAVRYAQVLPPVTLDPLRIDDVWSAQAANRVFEGLYTFGEGTDVVPTLATGMPKQTGSKGGKPTYEVEIREEATFQNSEAVTASDVKYSLETPVREDLPPKWSLDFISAVRTPSKRTVEIELAHPYPALRYALTQPIVPKAARESNPEKFATHPVGSGPFEAKVVKEGKYTVLKAWSDYWGPNQPAVSEVTFVGNHSGLARTTSLRSEQNELVQRVQPKLWRVTENMPNTEVTASKSLHSFFVGFNCNDGPTEDPKVRKAMDYLIDMDELVEHFVAPMPESTKPDNFVESGDGDDTPWRQFSPVPESVAREWDFPLGEWREIPRTKNPERAKTLLEESGVQNWTPVVATPKDMLREKFADALVQELSNIGYRKARTKTYHWDEYRKKIEAGNPDDYNMFVGSWAGWPDPDSFLYPLFHENVEGLTNFTFYSNEDVMNELLRARETTDRAKRKRLYESAIGTILEERAHLPAFTLHNTFGTASKLEGFEPHPVASVNPRFVGPEGAVSIRN